MILRVTFTCDGRKSIGAMGHVQEQLALRFEPSLANQRGSYRERLVALLMGDLDFHGQPTGHASHSFHAFPAKFPPQLSRLFIEALTKEDEVVLDPMMGSGTTIVEAFLAARNACGFDIDPLARLQSKVKISPLDSAQAMRQGRDVLEQAKKAVETDRSGLEARLEARFDHKLTEHAA